MGDRLDLVRDVLDKQLVDCHEMKMGRVDGVVLAIGDDEQPYVDHLELGFAVLARRVHPRLESWLARLRERWSVRRSARQIVPWGAVLDHNPKHIQLDVDALQTPAFDWERAMRRLVRRIPGGEEK